MVWANPLQPGESQLQRHAASHLPDGQDPLFQSTNANPQAGDVIVFQNGQWTTTNINQVVNTYLSQLFGSGLLGGDGGGEGDAGPPGPAGPAGAAGAAGAAGSMGAAVYMLMNDGEDGERGPPGQSGAQGSTGASGSGGGGGTSDDVLVLAYAVAL